MVSAENMELYNGWRNVPESAKKPIQGGSYGAAGLSDINPQWRIEKMTEAFGSVGLGWTWEPVYDTPQIEGYVFAHVIVRYCCGEGWSEPVHGFGGTRLGGKDDSDILKSTYTDALSNALRYLGIGANVWYDPTKAGADNQYDTKYSAPPQVQAPVLTTEQIDEMRNICTELEWKAIEGKYGANLVKMTARAYAGVMAKLKARKENDSE